MMIRNTIIAATLGLALAAAPAIQALAAWPERPISILVPWAAGGGTDALVRALQPIMERELNTPINVVNRAGGGGAVGHVAMAQAEPDGYTWGLASVELVMLNLQGVTQYGPQDYTPAAIVNGEAGALIVRADSPYQTAQELVDAIRDKPAGTFKASGTGQGGIWHLGLVGWLKSESLDPNTVGWIPSSGAAPALQDLTAGGVDFVVVSMPQARSLIDSGNLKPLANLDTSRQALYPSIPTIKEATGNEFVIQTWRGLVGPKGVPDDVAAKMRAALKIAYDDPAFKSLMEARGFDLVWIEGDAATNFMEAGEAQLGPLMKDAGLIR